MVQVLESMHGCVACSNLPKYIGMQECMQDGKCENQAQAKHDSNSCNAMQRVVGDAAKDYAVGR